MVCVVMSVFLDCRSPVRRKPVNSLGGFETAEFGKPRNALPSGESDFGDTLLCRIRDADFMLTPMGKLHWKTKSIESTLQLDIGQAHIVRAYFYIRENVLFLFYENSYGGEGSSRTEKIDLKNKRSVWKVHLYGFNLGVPYIRNDFAYVTTIGTIAKVGLKTGECSYYFDNLYDRRKIAFGHFDTIVFNGNVTKFVSRSDYYQRVDTILVDEKTNKYMIKHGSE